MSKPLIIEGACYNDERGVLKYNNDFDAHLIKRIYTIQNSETNPVRGWQGHKIEKRWFIAVYGAFEISTIQPDNWEVPSRNLVIEKFHIDQKDLTVLFVPEGNITAIKAIKENSILLVMSDYLLGEIKDEYRYALDYFQNNF